MASTITAKIGADASGLKKTLAETQTLTKATSRRIAEEAKRDTKAQDTAMREQAKTRSELAGKAMQSVSSLRNGLTSAASSGDIVASGFEAIGALGGPVAVVAAGAGLVASAMYSAEEHARGVRKTFIEMHRDSSFMSAESASAGELLAQSNKIAETFRNMKMEKSEAVGRLGVFSAPIKGTVANSLVDSLGERLNDFANGKGQSIIGTIFGDTDMITAGNTGFSTKGKQTALDAQAQKDMTEHRKDAARVGREDLDIARTRLTVSEREAEMEEAKAQAARAVGKIRAEMTKNNATPEEIEGIVGPMQEQALLEQMELIRKGNQVWAEYGDEAVRQSTAAAIATTRETSQIEALNLEIAETARQQKLLRDTMAGDPHEERNLERQRKVNDLEAKGVELARQKGAAQRAIDAARDNALNAQKAAQIEALAATNQDLASKQKIAQIDQQIAQIKGRKTNMDEVGKAGADAEIAGLEGQKEQEQLQRDQLSPKQKRARALADQRNAARLRHNRAADKSKESDEKHRAENNARDNEGFLQEGRNARARADKYREQLARPLFVPPIPNMVRPDIRPNIQGANIGDAIGKAAVAALENARIVIRNTAVAILAFWTAWS